MNGYLSAPAAHAFYFGFQLDARKPPSSIFFACPQPDYTDRLVFLQLNDRALAGAVVARHAENRLRKTVRRPTGTLACCELLCDRNVSWPCRLHPAASSCANDRQYPFDRDRPSCLQGSGVHAKMPSFANLSLID